MPLPSALANILTTAGPLPSESVLVPAAALQPGHSSAMGPLPTADLPGVSGELLTDARSSPSIAAAICNLLSVGGDNQSAKLPGLYVGEGLPPRFR